MDRDSGTDSAIGGWLRRLVRPQKRESHKQLRKSSALASQISTDNINDLKSKADKLQNRITKTFRQPRNQKPKWTLVA